MNPWLSNLKMIDIYSATAFSHVSVLELIVGYIRIDYDLVLVDQQTIARRFILLEQIKSAGYSFRQNPLTGKLEIVILSD